MEDGRDPAVLNYETRDPPERHVPVNPLAFFAWLIFVSLTAWFVWGLMEGIQIFYGPAGGPGKAAHWNRIVNVVGAGGATTGILLAAFALRNPATSRGASLSALAINGLALVLFGVLLVLSLF